MNLYPKSHSIVGTCCLSEKPTEPVSCDYFTASIPDTDVAQAGLLVTENSHCSGSHEPPLSHPSLGPSLHHLSYLDVGVRLVWWLWGSMACTAGYQGPAFGMNVPQPGPSQVGSVPPPAFTKTKQRRSMGKSEFRHPEVYPSLSPSRWARTGNKVPGPGLRLPGLLLSIDAPSC